MNCNFHKIKSSTVNKENQILQRSQHLSLAWSSSDFHSTELSYSHPGEIGADSRYKPPIIRMFGSKSKKKTA